MGQNIGTCVTALISAVGASKNAKRAAFVHLYFNIIGTIIFMAGFYIAHAIVGFAFFDEAATPAGIAVVHSTFNIVATLILLPFHKGLEKLAILTVRDKPGEAGEEAEQEAADSALALLDNRFLAQPSIAVDNSRDVAVRMAHLSRKALFKALENVFQFDKERAGQVEKLENKVDLFEDTLGTYLIKLSSRDLNEEDSQKLSMLLHSVSDIERISDHALNISEKAQEIYDKKVTFSEQGRRELEIFTNAVRDIVNMAVDALENDNVELARQVEPLEEVVDRLNDLVKNRHIMRLQTGECSLDSGFILNDLAVNYERVADHCSNIAVDLIRIHENDFEVHEYLDDVKNSEDPEFMELYREDRDKYRLPDEKKPQK